MWLTMWLTLCDWLCDWLCGWLYVIDYVVDSVIHLSHYRWIQTWLVLWDWVFVIESIQFSLRDWLDVFCYVWLALCIWAAWLVLCDCFIVSGSVWFVHTWLESMIASLNYSYMINALWFAPYDDCVWFAPCDWLLVIGLCEVTVSSAVSCLPLVPRSPLLLTQYGLSIRTRCQCGLLIT